MVAIFIQYFALGGFHSWNGDSIRTGIHCQFQYHMNSWLFQRAMEKTRNDRFNRKDNLDIPFIARSGIRRGLIF